MAGPLFLVGCGKMGGALLAGWLKRGMPPERVTVIEPAPGEALRGMAGIHVVSSAAALPAGSVPETLVIAVKPQAMDDALAPLGAVLAARPLTLSIAAGKTLAYFTKRLGAEVPAVRAMPNTPAAVGHGITVLCANRHVTARQRAEAESLMAAVGAVAWIEDEAQMDAVTAVSGSGPAYVFLLVEALAEAGTAAGLAPALAMRLARATVAGSGYLLDQTERKAAALRADVTSPGGTTAAALKELMGPEGLEALMRRAVAAATRRGRELAG